MGVGFQLDVDSPGNGQEKAKPVFQDNDFFLVAVIFKGMGRKKPQSGVFQDNDFFTVAVIFQGMVKRGRKTQNPEFSSTMSFSRWL